MKRSIRVCCAVFLALAVTCVVAVSDDSVVKKTGKIRGSNVPPLEKNLLNKKDVMSEIQKQMALERAQAWLLQLGYDLTIDQVVNLKSLSAVGGTIERAQALTTENMENLRVLTNLEYLELAQFGTDDWVANAAGLVKLKSFLMQPASRITDRSCDVFANMPDLVQLGLDGCTITDQGFAKLSGLRKLKHLRLQYAKIGDASMTIIGQNTDLETLNLSFTKVTDAGLPHLYNLTKLTYLSLQSQTLSPNAVALLRAQLPNCNVVYP